MIANLIVLIAALFQDGFIALREAPGSYCAYACMYFTLCLIKIFNIATQTFEEQRKHIIGLHHINVSLLYRGTHGSSVSLASLPYDYTNNHNMISNLSSMHMTEHPSSLLLDNSNNNNNNNLLPPTGFTGLTVTSGGPLPSLHGMVADSSSSVYESYDNYDDIPDSITDLKDYDETSNIVASSQPLLRKTRSLNSNSNINRLLPKNIAGIAMVGGNNSPANNNTTMINNTTTGANSNNTMTTTTSSINIANNTNTTNNIPNPATTAPSQWNWMGTMVSAASFGYISTTDQQLPHINLPDDSKPMNSNNNAISAMTSTSSLLTISNQKHRMLPPDNNNSALSIINNSSHNNATNTNTGIGGTEPLVTMSNKVGNSLGGSNHGVKRLANTTSQMSLANTETSSKNSDDGM